MERAHCREWTQTKAKKEIQKIIRFYPILLKDTKITNE